MSYISESVEVPNNLRGELCTMVEEDESMDGWLWVGEIQKLLESIYIDQEEVEDMYENYSIAASVGICITPGYNKDAYHEFTSFADKFNNMKDSVNEFRKKINQTNALLHKFVDCSIGMKNIDDLHNIDFQDIKCLRIGLDIEINLRLEEWKQLDIIRGLHSLVEQMENFALRFYTDQYDKCANES